MALWQSYHMEPVKKRHRNYFPKRAILYSFGSRNIIVNTFQDSNNESKTSEKV